MTKEQSVDLSLREDIKAAVRELTPREARYMVDLYYMVQRDRIRAGNQHRALTSLGEPAKMISAIAQGFQVHEDAIRLALDHYSRETEVGRWSRSVTGVGPVIAAGLLAHIDIKLAPTAGHIWNFAGLNPEARWLSAKEAADIVKTVCGARGPITNDQILALASVVKRRPELLLNIEDRTRANLAKTISKRPWNGKLKVLCWKLGESFVKSSGNVNSFYGPLYVQRKAYEEQRNESGELAGQAEAALSDKTYGTDTKAFKHYSEGHLPPARIHARACRWVVKLFLSHWHYVACATELGIEPPAPYALTHTGHAHLIRPPGW